MRRCCFHSGVLKDCGSVALLAGVLLLWPVTAQGAGLYQISWYTINGGGRTSAGGPYALAGTIGQPDADGCKGGKYELLGGFWPGEPVSSADCFPSNFSTYTDWVTLGKPACWCGPYQCDGDADGLTSGFPFNYRVFTGDLALIVANWQKKADDLTLDPCADIDHQDSGFPFYYRVFTGDLSILVANWKKKETNLPGNCPRAE
jgi:hypothetical protein